ncbi:MAG: hypothetical protein ACJAYU_001361 [Bradymonadia bacterium]|jgi:hypothetical protein
MAGWPREREGGSVRMAKNAKKENNGGYFAENISFLMSEFGRATG